MCKDKELLTQIIDSYSVSEKTENEILSELKKCNDNGIEFPVDKFVIEKLKALNAKLKETDKEFALFENSDEINNLWRDLISKAIKCLRYYDKRETFSSNPEKKPLAYGIEELFKYYEDYTEFEKILYGGASFYRDHVLHVFRVWLLGLNTCAANDFEYLKILKLPTSEKDNIPILSNVEKLSIWTIISLTHDLGYPLEKAQKVITQTQKMVKPFINNPKLTMDLSFDGVQNTMNDFVIKFISSKMKKNEDNDEYKARLQSKYYFKYQKSLEQNQHGILSCLIIYKMLVYFLESDFSLNEDYKFDVEEARQFFIRREILRAIASHTCEDIYHMHAYEFSFLLIIADDAQDWGRKGIENLYVDTPLEYNFGDICFTNLSKGEDIECHVNDKYVVPYESIKSLNDILEKIIHQYKTNIKMFRDGQETSNRDFSFKKITTAEIKKGNNPNIHIVIDIDKNAKSSLKICLPMDFKHKADLDQIDVIKKQFDFSSNEYIFKEFH